MQRELERSERERVRLERERDRLRRENERLKHELDLARRAAKRQAAPFSKGPPVARPRRAGRRRGWQHGRHGHRSVPPRVDTVIAVPVPPTCPHCAGAVAGERVAAGTISAHGAAVARGHVLSQVFTALDHVGTLPAMQRFAAHLRVELPALFSFLFDPTVDATNWRAEHALRPAVVNRKVSGGNRSARGADTQQVLTSVLRTAHQRQLDPTQVLVDLLHAPQPTVSRTLVPLTEASPR